MSKPVKDRLLIGFEVKRLKILWAYFIITI